MGFQHESTLAGYARAATDDRIRMAEYASGPWFPEHVRDWYEVRFVQDGRRVFRDASLADFARLTTRVWQARQPNVVAPAMTAILAAAASSLDLSGEVLTDDTAPDDHGIVFFPEPVYQRDPDGGIHGISAITWTRVPPLPSLRMRSPSWMVVNWAALQDPHDRKSILARELIDQDPRQAAQAGPYLMVDRDVLPIGEPLTQIAWVDGPDNTDTEWQTTLDGRCVIDAIAGGLLACSQLIYAYWRISSQPLATAVTPPLDRPARRRAARASLLHDTRVVMLRRTSPITEPGDGEAKWHYRVRFVVKGHWRRLHDQNGQPYRIWINAYIKGPDRAPLLHGEKVAVLAR
ncbi:hypothetical protein K1W54_06935 [Micromonospora sp. CPCC 205371]|nr:hypothetical protein [Micromonospora sp. CPCC 205371]